ncbi:MAG: hypothetical protein ABI570_08890 [Ilumatobacteraceae bacterium]
MKKLVRLAIFVTPIVFIASCGSDSPSTTTDSTITRNSVVEFSVVVGVDSAADRVEQIPLGSTVRVQITNFDAADEFHLHGYDIESGEVAVGETATIEFEAITAGSFEIESHVTEQVLLVLQIS